MASAISPRQRSHLFGQVPSVIWFTGLSGSGKTTLANQLEVHLHDLRFKTFLLDGDNVRSGLCSDLDFSDRARSENLRRVAEVAKLFVESGVIVLATFISPFEEDRVRVRKIIGHQNLIEVFLDCPLEVCEQRDTKGLYKRARAGEIKNFTGIGSRYEVPVSPDITINTQANSIDVSVGLLMKVIIPKISLPAGR